ncbi:hypothetical protein KIN20_005107 [Parelaphostrongylus tenuis]|uniref:G-protein coupled receptors family 1 profile domain-containing protein n=1 Tax=Parelaphostrongylus tenuis TaxID=148309 RepID=A0AAD5M2Q5_PARTN|nr:hypothetical protein KIN20_005107 [Parelaphostrongylus tenuis]
MTGTNSLTHLFGSFLMTLNRFTAVNYPSKQGINVERKIVVSNGCEKAPLEIWRKRNVCIILAIDVITSYLVHIPLYSNRIRYAQRDDRWCYDGREEPLNVLRIINGAIAFFYEVISIILIVKTVSGMNKSLHMSDSRYSNNMRLLSVTAISCFISGFGLIYELSSLQTTKATKTHVLEWILNQYDDYFLLFMTMNAYSIMLLSEAVRHELARRWRRVLPRSNFRAITLF